MSFNIHTHTNTNVKIIQFQLSMMVDCLVAAAAAFAAVDVVSYFPFCSLYRVVLCVMLKKNRVLYSWGGLRRKEKDGKNGNEKIGLVFRSFGSF